jgi:hypothetical protein
MLSITVYWWPKMSLTYSSAFGIEVDAVGEDALLVEFACTALAGVFDEQLLVRACRRPTVGRR